MDRTGDTAREARRLDGFRPDLEGLRGLAVALVVAYHATTLSNAPFKLTGGFIGVDVFFVLSGFLITGLLLRERETKGRISFSHFYARRIRRILPAAMATLLVTLVLSYFLVNAVDRSSVMLDGASASLSLANVRFLIGINYFAQFTEPQMIHYSPFTQFWSLSVEEQFYLIWPALLALAMWRPRFGAAALLVVVVVASFSVSVLSSALKPSEDFYLLPGRAWQLGAGGLVAVFWGSQDRLSPALRPLCNRLLAVAGWAAMLALVLAACVINFGATPYSAVSTLVPVVAGVLIIASGALEIGPGALLGLAPIRFLGRISYSLYLWHWPILVLGGLLMAGPFQAITPAQACLLVLLSLVVAAASWVLIEEPIRQGRIALPRPGRLVAAGVEVMVIVALVGAGLTIASESGLGSTSATGGSAPFSIAGLSPSLAIASADFDVACVAIDTATTPDPECAAAAPGAYSVALIGDSHAAALRPAVNGVAKLHGWHVRSYLRTGCPFLDLRTIDWGSRLEDSACEAWNRNVLSNLAASPPNLVVISMSRLIYPLNAADDNVITQSAALVAMIGKLPSTSRVVIIQDLPMPDKEVPECLSLHATDYRACAYSRREGYRWDMGVRERSAAAVTGAGLVDLTDDVCPGTGYCPVVVDHMIVWRDEYHLTATFSASLAPALDEQLAAILELPAQVTRRPDRAIDRASLGCNVSPNPA